MSIPSRSIQLIILPIRSLLTHAVSPTLLLDTFLYEYTPCPLSIFVNMEENKHHRPIWFSLVTQICQPDCYDSQYSTMFKTLLKQIEILMSSPVPVISSSSSIDLQEIGDPFRERNFYEILHDTYVHRLHVSQLIEHETQLEIKVQLQLMMEQILDHFPYLGLTTTCSMDLLKLYLVNFQNL